MSKKSKKRNKMYQGADAKFQTPTIHRYKAVMRSRQGEWWHEHKRMIKIVASVAGGVLIVVWLLIELFGLVF